MTKRVARYRVLREVLARPVLLALGMSAQAQVTPKAAAPEEDALQEVVVTGSRIARPEFDNLEPTTSVDSKTFDQRGYLDVGQALSELPAFGMAAFKRRKHAERLRHRPKLRRSVRFRFAAHLDLGQRPPFRLLEHGKLDQ